MLPDFTTLIGINSLQPAYGVVFECRLLSQSSTMPGVYILCHAIHALVSLLNEIFSSFLVDFTLSEFSGLAEVLKIRLRMIKLIRKIANCLMINPPFLVSMPH
ncbi:MAG: hypothetical protein ACP5PA_07215 [Elusimicrobiales bacterium]